VSGSKYKTYEDSELISLCLKGDALAWEALITRYRRLIYSIPVRFAFDPADASDVFQSVCLKLLEHLHDIKDDRKISGWLVTTTTRQCIHLKQLKTRETASDDGTLKEQTDPANSIEELKILTEREQAVRDSVEELTPRCRNLIGMLYFDSKFPSYDEIGQRMEMPVASIGPTRARCLEKLRAVLRRRGIK